MKLFLFILSLSLLIQINNTLKAQKKEGYPCSNEYPADDYLFRRCFQMTNNMRATGQYQKVLSNFNLLLKGAERNKDRYRIAQIKLHIGLTYHDMFDKLYYEKIFIRKKNIIIKQDSLRCLKYLDNAIFFVSKAYEIFDKIIYKHLLESSYLNSKTILDNLKKLRTEFTNDYNIPPEVVILSSQLIELTKTKDKLLEIIIKNMEFNHNMIELAKANRLKDSIWFDLTKSLVAGKITCDTNMLYLEYINLKRITDNFINLNNITEHTKTNSSGISKYYYFDGKSPEDDPGLYIQKINDLNNKSQFLIQETEDFSQVLRNCQKPISTNGISNIEHFWGIKSSFTHSFYSGEDSPEKALFNPGFNAGLFVEFGLLNNNRLSLLAELFYDVKGSKWEMDYLNETTTFNSYIHYVNFNIIGSYLFFSPIYFQVGLHIGYLHDLVKIDSLSYLLEGSSLKARAGDKYYGASINEFENLNYWDLGLTFGIESNNIKMPFWGYMSIALNYTHSLSDFPLNIQDVIEYNKLNNNVIELSLKWKFEM